MPPSLSVILITFNAERTLRQCLDSVHWAGEIIVVDSGSTDETCIIASRYTPHVFMNPWPGFGAQKNYALERATGEWILSLDADEWLTPPLIKEIQTLLQEEQRQFPPKGSPSHWGYRIPRLTSFCGQVILHGDWKRDTPLRLFRRTWGRFTDVPVHESVILSPQRQDPKIQQFFPLGRLSHPIRHDSFPSLEEALDKMNRYSSLSADQMKTQGIQGSVTLGIAKGVWTFFRGYCLRGGFRDGRAGFVLAVLNAYTGFFKAIKASDLNSK